MDPVVKQQAAERLRQANNILVTVSSSPSVDQLAAAIGMTLLLNKLGKHATTVFSGTVPSTLEFLQPEKTIEHTVDNLRDFIISLDKSKADKLHFKVEGEVVRIYITPYKTTLGEKDLTYAQGDFNVDVILALGVQNRNQIDTALSAHGRILHDATTVAVGAGAGKPPDIGQINWQDSSASSLCEMMMSMSESFGNGLIDAQMATAFLTGIVAETERFRNSKTSPKVMTMSAQLMAAGANQQLIASKLDLDKKPEIAPAQPQPKQAEATIQVDHSKDVPQAQPIAQQKPAVKPAQKTVEKPAEKPKKAVVEPKPIIKIDTPHIDIDREGNVSPTDTSKLEGQDFVPAPPSFQPPPATPIPQPDEEVPDDVSLPGEHKLLDPSQHQPSFNAPISSESQPNLTGGSVRPPETATLGESEAKQQAADQAKSLQDARAEIENAMNSASAQPTKPADTSPEAPKAPSLPPPLPQDVIDPNNQ